MKNKESLLFSLVLSVAILSPSRVFGMGSHLVEKDSAAKVRGDALTATARNLPATYSNPAGIAKPAGYHAGVAAASECEQRRGGVARQLAYRYAGNATGGTPEGADRRIHL